MRLKGEEGDAAAGGDLVGEGVEGGARPVVEWKPHELHPHGRRHPEALADIGSRLVGPVGVHAEPGPALGRLHRRRLGRIGTLAEGRAVGRLGSRRRRDRGAAGRGGRRRPRRRRGGARAARSGPGATSSRSILSAVTGRTDGPIVPVDVGRLPGVTSSLAPLDVILDPPRGADALRHAGRRGR